MRSGTTSSATTTAWCCHRGRLFFWLRAKDATGRWRPYRIGSNKEITAARAREIAEDLAADVAKGGDIFAERERRQQDAIEAERAAEQAKGRTLDAFLDEKDGDYGKWVLAHRKDGANTLKRLRACFADFMDKPLDEIHTFDVERWRSQQRKAGKSVATVNRDITALKAVLSKALEWGKITHHLLAGLKPLKLDALAER